MRTVLELCRNQERLSLALALTGSAIGVSPRNSAYAQHAPFLAQHRRSADVQTDRCSIGTLCGLR
jgi:hypothetical protein